jgi:heme/copper-type cytochrome/quinol oxidase subunit 2
MEKTEIPELQSTPAPPDTASWFEYSWKLQQEAPQRFEEASKFLVGVISFTITIMTTAQDKLQRLTTHSDWLLGLMILWLVALVFAFIVLFPTKYRFNADSVASIKKATTKMVRFKRAFFLISALLYFISLIILTILFFC